MSLHRCDAHPATRDLNSGRLFLLAMLSSMLCAPAGQAEDQPEQRKPLARISTNCADCGVVRAIREVRTEREAQHPDVYVGSPQYRDTMPAELPRIGPAISLTWGKGERPRTQIGAFTTPEMRHRYIDITYEISVRFDDGRFGNIEQDVSDDLRVGDRVILIKRRLEKIGD
jgi:hypothetical protein